MKELHRKDLASLSGPESCEADRKVRSEALTGEDAGEVWDVIATTRDRLTARLEWTRPELLAVFPFRHKVEMTATLLPESLTIETAVIAGDPVPVSFGFHPYFGIPNRPRSQWRLELPAMRKLVLDDRGIPTGKEESFDRLDTLLGELDLDAGFIVLDERPKFSLSGGGRRITVEFLENYRYAQIFAPKGKDFVALEPMPAPSQAVKACGLSNPAERSMQPFGLGLTHEPL